MNILILVSIIIVIMLVWFNSDAIIEWGSLFGLSKFLKTDEFYKRRIKYYSDGMTFNYPTFLKEKYNYNFITKMLSCPLCFAIWICTTACILISIIWLVPKILLLIPIVIVLSLIGYGLITTLLKLS